MQRGNGILILRGVLAALVLTLGIVQLTTGRVVIGLLLVAISAVSVTLTVTMYRRRKELVERYPRLAQRRRQGPTPTPH